MNTEITKIADEARSKIVTKGNVNDVPNLIVSLGLDSKSADLLTNAIAEFPDEARILVVYGDKEYTPNDKTIEIPPYGVLSLKQL